MGTLREMLRIKRSVQHQYNTQVNMMSAQMLSGALAASEDAESVLQPPEDSMKQLDNNAAAAGESSKENVNAKSNIMFVRGETQSKAVLEAETKGVANPDEIDLDDDDESDEDDEDEAEDGGEPAAKKSKIEKQAI